MVRFRSSFAYELGGFVTDLVLDFVEKKFWITHSSWKLKENTKKVVSLSGKIMHKHKCFMIMFITKMTME